MWLPREWFDRFFQVFQDQLSQGYRRQCGHIDPTRPSLNKRSGQFFHQNLVSRINQHVVPDHGWRFWFGCVGLLV